MLCNSRILQLSFECFCVPRSGQDIAAPGSGRKQRLDRQNELLYRLSSISLNRVHIHSMTQNEQ